MQFFTWHELSQLSFRRRALITLKDHKDAGCGIGRHPTHRLVSADWGLAHGWRTTTADWEVGFPACTLQQLKRIAIHRTFKVVDSEQKRLVTWKHSSGLSEYLLPRGGDLSAVARLRAQLRLDRSTLKESLQRRNIRPASLHCVLCHDQNCEEDLEHVVLRCPAYRSPRRKLQAMLSRLSLPLTAQVVLGDLSPGIPAAIRRAALVATGNYLTAVYNLRGQL